MKQSEVKRIAKEVFNETRGTHLVEDGISLCVFVSKHCGVELTLAEAEKVQFTMDAIEKEETKTPA